MKKYLGLSLISCCFSSYAAQYVLTDNNIVGTPQTVIAQKGDTLNRLAVRYGMGYNEMLKANTVWRGRKIPAGTELNLPTQHQLPNEEKQGIIINLADLRLFYYPTDGGSVITYPVAIGKYGWATPKGLTSVIKKIKHPTWTPPPSIRREAARRGKTLRAVYPAGPNNPLGTRALRLGIPGYLIHGTNKPYSIGKRVSHGCIRMRRKDIEALYNVVPVNTQVKIINEPSNLPLSNLLVQNQTVPVAAPVVSQKSYKNSIRKHKKKYRARKAKVQKQKFIFNHKELEKSINSGVARPVDLSNLQVK